MNIPVKSNHPNNRVVNQKKLEEREAWHKLAAKVIIWKDGISGPGRLVEKISSKEWATYSTRIVAINVTYGKEKMLADLKETWQKISGHGGFE